MATSTVIFGLLVVGVAAAIVTLFRPSAQRNADQHAMSPSKLNSKGDGRASDERVLSPAAKKTLKRAKALMAQGEHRQASLVLEHIGLHREAISMLENAGLIDEAAGVLMKMRRPNRAGVVYARHGRWDAAAECFKVANLPFEAAKCLREVNKHAEAVEFFLEAGRHDDAAASLMTIKNYQGAGKLFLKIGQRDKALKAYEEMTAKGDHGTSATFDDTELDFLQEAVENGSAEFHFIDILGRHGRILRVIKTFIESGKIAEATRLYQGSNTDLGPLLMSEVNLQSKDATILATIFKQSSQPRYAGMVLEQVGDYSGSAECFEDCGEFERASYCWDRAGNRERAKQATARRLSPSQDVTTFTGSENQTTEVVGKKSPPQSQQASSPSIAKPNAAAPLAVGVFSIENVSVFAPDAMTAHMDVDRSVFEGCSLFAGLDRSQIQKIWTIIKVENVAAGTNLSPNEGKLAGIYLIADGTVVSDSTHSATSNPRTELQQNEYFGDIWTFTGCPEVSHFSSKSPCRFLLLEQSKLIAIFEADGRIAHKVYKNFTARLFQGNSNPLKPRLNLRAS